MSDKLTITSVSSGGPDLVGWYFKTKSDGTVDLYDKQNNKKTPIPVGVNSEFPVTVDGVNVNLSIASFSIQGTWHDGDSQVDGTYQANASGTGADDEESAASANA